jgi:hypothetical protein
MEDAVTDLGRRIIEVSRLAVAMHLNDAQPSPESEPGMLVQWHRQVKSALHAGRLNGNFFQSAQGRAR